MRNYLVYFIAILTGGMGVLAFSPFDLWAIAYLSLAGLIWVAKKSQKKTALLASFLWGLSFFGIGVNWLNVSIYQFGGTPLIVSYLLVILLAGYLALYPVLFTYLVQRFRVQSLAMFPAVWTLTESLRSWVFTGFPWLQFGYTQLDSPFANLAALFGVEGLTFFVMWISAVIFSLISQLIQSKKQWAIIITHSVLLVVMLGLSASTALLKFTQENPQKSLNVTLVQGNIEQQLKWDPDYFYQTLTIYQRLINRSLDDSDLIILPEAALPVLENHIQPYLQTLQQLAQEKGVEVVIGTIYQEESEDKLLNSIVNLGNADEPYHLNTKNRYAKHHLVPFGEYVPLDKILRPLGSVFNLPMSSFASGDFVQKPFLAKNRHFTPAICYEIIFGSQLQQNLTKQSDFILTISNDAWFGDSIGPWQHLQMARMRAIELGRPVIRATNTGITAFIDAQGKIVAQAPQFTETTLRHKIVATEGMTPYAILGTKPLYLLISLLVLFRSLGTLIRKKLTQG
ncbi:apolipoprotein N-acyltransferase [Histophilus somni]|uniref:apolipoprotein N-acyltransferase n=1 Tax=Histophilus somni TaxID=731 RepID=UPI00094B25A7|nr:apolipoprotein N-acyltransferase [Histophilus somni]